MVMNGRCTGSGNVNDDYFQMRRAIHDISAIRQLIGFGFEIRNVDEISALSIEVHLSIALMLGFATYRMSVQLL